MPFRDRETFTCTFRVCLCFTKRNYAWLERPKREYDRKDERERERERESKSNQNGGPMRRL